MRPILPALAIATFLATGGAMAQSSRPDAAGNPPLDAPMGPADRTGSITATGQTKPPGDALGPADGTNSRLDERSRELDRKIRTGICSGCD